MKKLNELTLVEALEGLKSKKFTSVELTKACLDQIKKYDPTYRAFLTLVEDEALKQAEKCDELIKRDGSSAFLKASLLGIPYACKDNFSTKGVQTTAGSNILRGYIPPFESTVTQKLKDAGAVLLGKTNMDAFAHGSSTETSDFFKTFNPWDKSRVPGGSSGGSAVAVSADMCIFAIGSETAGSVRGPASWCGITGLKPTYGRVSRYGVVAMVSSMDSPGPLTKTVEDAALVLSVISGKDPLDATSSNFKPYVYEGRLATKDLKGIRIGKPKSYFNLDMESGVKDKILEALEEFKKLGAQIVNMDLMDPKYSIAVYTILQRSEVSSNLARFDGIRYGHDRDLFGFEARKRMMLGTYTLSAGYYDAYYSKAQRVRSLTIHDFNHAFNDVDFVAGPTMPCVAQNIGESEKSSLYGELMDILNEPSAISGLPAVVVPCGFSNSLPVGIQLIGPQFSESRIIKAASAYQNATSFHKEKPKLEEKKG